MKTSLTITDYSTEIPGSLNAERTRWEFPNIVSFHKAGRELFWRQYVSLRNKSGNQIKIKTEWLQNKSMSGDPINAIIDVEAGMVDGKIKKSSPTIVTAGKNIGKVNETNVLCQALRDAFGKYNKQLRKSTIASTKLKPMTAEIYNAKKLKQADFDSQPIIVQKKYNGLRAIITTNDKGEIIMYSRGLIDLLPWSELFQDLVSIFAKYPGLHLDGEIYQHGSPLQLISGKVRSGNYNNLTYCCYDIFFSAPTAPALSATTHLTTIERLELLEEKLDINSYYVEIADNIIVSSAKEIDEQYKQYLAEGYEGAMIRLNAPYEHRRSKSLLKMKPSFDDEFEIVGFMSGDIGKASEALMMKCKIKNGNIFNVTPAETLDERNRLFALFHKNPKYFEEHYLGKMLVVEYDELSKDGVPQRARTKLLIRNKKTDEYKKIS